MTNCKLKSDPDMNARLAVGPLEVAQQHLKLSESGQYTCLLFVDIIKPFGTVNREMLWQGLAQCGIKMFYSNITLNIRSERQNAH